MPPSEETAPIRSNSKQVPNRGDAEVAEGIVTEDLDFDLTSALGWFTHEHSSPFVLVRMPETEADELVKRMAGPLRRCYVQDSVLASRSDDLGLPRAAILAAKLPDPGSVRAGDFGEILVYIYEATRHLPVRALSPKKWRLKQDRNQPAPHSDVVHFVLPSWPRPTEQDLLICSEVKTKSTAGSFRPIPAAIEGSNKDRASRLASTLVWLRARALGEDLGEVNIHHIDRFLHAEDYPVAEKRFQAAVVVCESLAEDCLLDAPVAEDLQPQVLVLTVPSLHRLYTSVYEAALASSEESHATRGE